MDNLKVASAAREQQSSVRPSARQGSVSFEAGEVVSRPFKTRLRVDVGSKPTA